MMKKIYGATGRQDGLYKIGRNKYQLIYGFGKESEEADSGWNWRESFYHKPTWGEIKAQLTESINEQTQDNIINGFEWKGQKIWLSEQVQMNLNSIEGAKFPEGQYPIGIKVNEDAEGEAIYMTFNNAEEFSTFHQHACEHVVATLDAGWKEKQALKKADFGF